ncbi:histone-lysine N-methyltransferase SUVR2-like protein [Corchorus olitorius]|uniref:Histone-lysine N-methyltransferase SUVR2-like protein n=1 Tax=Corchorus olitorius TaxID=93759 RepID=A0A1R3KS24_9ROSI|nr:histone-lysine N-methyltransferase SUVR2-like protein [Corchorus olitorius]
MTNANDELPPVMENLPPLTRSIIMNFEDILQLAYPAGSLSTSCQIQQKPNFKSAIKAIIALPNNQIACDEQTISILKHSLQIRESEIPTQEEAEAILQQPEILTQIFSRGLANHLPPSYTLLKPIVKRKFQKLTTNFTSIAVKGERCETTCLTTFPIFRAWITVSSTLDLESTTTQHNIHITLDPIGPTILEQASTSWEAEEHPQQKNTPDRIAILIYNARGVARPSFTRIFTRTIAIYRPQIIIITETRTSMGQQFLESQCGDHSILHTIDPLGYFGGSWIMYNRRQIITRVLNISRRDITFQLLNKEN